MPHSPFPITARRFCVDGLVMWLQSRTGKRSVGFCYLCTPRLLAAAGNRALSSPPKYSSSRGWSSRCQCWDERRGNWSQRDGREAHNTRHSSTHCQSSWNPVHHCPNHASPLDHPAARSKSQIERLSAVGMDHCNRKSIMHERSWDIQPFGRVHT